MEYSPTIVQVYHGALPFYIGMPLYALLGTGVFGVRIANFIFGTIVIIAASIFLRAFRVRPIFVGLALTTLVLDPGFLFSFRTQFYITLLSNRGAVAIDSDRRKHRQAIFLADRSFRSGFACWTVGLRVFHISFLAPVAAR